MDVQSYGKTPKPNGMLQKPRGILRKLMLPVHAAPAQIPGCLPLTGSSKRVLLVCSKVQQTLRSSPHERRIPKNSCFCCFFLNKRHWVTLPYLLPRTNTILVQCDRLVPRAGDGGESQEFGLDSRDPRARGLQRPLSQEEAAAETGVASALGEALDLCNHKAKNLS